MGSGRSRSNINPVSAGSQLGSGSTAGTSKCRLEADFPARALVPLEEARGVGEVVSTPDGVGLSLNNKLVALLVKSGRVTEIVGCMSRGWEYTGVLTNEQTVRLWNAP